MKLRMFFHGSVSWAMTIGDWDGHSVSRDPADQSSWRLRSCEKISLQQVNRAAWWPRNRSTGAIAGTRRPTSIVLSLSMLFTTLMAGVDVTPAAAGLFDVFEMDGNALDNPAG